MFGIKGGAAGGGLSQVVPIEDLNLHFTGDIHAIGAANNLLAAMLDASILHGNPHKIDALRIGWRRAVDMNDRVPRNIVVGAGGRPSGYPRETGFDITAASEVMAVMAVSRDLQDLRRRLGAITVARSYDGGAPVTADDLVAAGAMTVVLKDALKPNLIQTLEGQPCIMHCGPFANIAHGNNSLVADLIGMKLGDYLVTESGFGSDMGMEKFFDIVCRFGGLTPSAAVLVTSVRGSSTTAASPTTPASTAPTGCGRSRPACQTSAATSGSSRNSASREDFRLTVRDIRPYTGAGWLVPLCGDITQMPGLGKTPAALNVDIDDEGRTVGLFRFRLGSARSRAECPVFTASHFPDIRTNLRVGCSADVNTSCPEYKVVAVDLCRVVGQRAFTPAAREPIMS